MDSISTLENWPKEPLLNSMLSLEMRFDNAINRRARYMVQDEYPDEYFGLAVRARQLMGEDWSAQEINIMYAIYSQAIKDWKCRLVYDSLIKTMRDERTHL